MRTPPPHYRCSFAKWILMSILISADTAVMEARQGKLMRMSEAGRFPWYDIAPSSENDLALAPSSSGRWQLMRENGASEGLMRRLPQHATSSPSPASLLSSDMMPNVVPKFDLAPPIVPETAPEGAVTIPMPSPSPPPRPPCHVLPCEMMGTPPPKNEDTGPPVPPEYRPDDVPVVPKSTAAPSTTINNGNDLEVSLPGSPDVEAGGQAAATGGPAPASVGGQSATGEPAVGGAAARVPAAAGPAPSPAAGNPAPTNRQVVHDTFVLQNLDTRNLDKESVTSLQTGITTEFAGKLGTDPKNIGVELRPTGTELSSAALGEAKRASEAAATTGTDVKVIIVSQKPIQEVKNATGNVGAELVTMASRIEGVVRAETGTLAVTNVVVSAEEACVGGGIGGDPPKGQQNARPILMLSLFGSCGAHCDKHEWYGTFEWNRCANAYIRTVDRSIPDGDRWRPTIRFDANASSWVIGSPHPDPTYLFRMPALHPNQSFCSSDVCGDPLGSYAVWNCRPTPSNACKDVDLTVTEFDPLRSRCPIGPLKDPVEPPNSVTNVTLHGSCGNSCQGHLWDGQYSWDMCQGCYVRNTDVLPSWRPTIYKLNGKWVIANPRPDPTHVFEANITGAISPLGNYSSWLCLTGKMGLDAAECAGVTLHLEATKPSALPSVKK